MPIPSEMNRRSGPSRDDVAVAVKQIVSEQTDVPPEEINESHDLETDLGSDSLTMIEITMEIEEHFGIDIPDEISEKSRKIGPIIDDVMELLELGSEKGPKDEADHVRM